MADRHAVEFCDLRRSHMQSEIGVSIMRIKRGQSESDTADVSVQSVDVTISYDKNAPVLETKYHLRAAYPADPRPLLVNFSECPLWPLALSGTASVSIDWGSGKQITLDKLFLNRRADASWDESILTISLKWNQRSRRQRPIEEAYMYLPTELPEIGAHGNNIMGNGAQLPLSLHGMTERLLAGSIGASLDKSSTNEGSYLQAILSRKNASRCIGSERGDVDVHLLDLPDDKRAQNNAHNVCSFIREICHFYSERLNASPVLQLAAALSSPENAKLSGTLISQSFERYRLPEMGQPGYEFPIAREIASVWWGAGCRVAGAQGLFLARGIAFAMAFSWMEFHASTEAFDALLSWYRQRLVPRSMFAGDDYRPGERSTGIGLVLYEALAREPIVWNALQKLTSEFWGRYAPESTVLAALEAVGVPVKDFDHKRFRRD